MRCRISGENIVAGVAASGRHLEISSMADLQLLGLGLDMYVSVRFRVRFRARVWVGVRVRGDYFLRLHTAFSIGLVR